MESMFSATSRIDSESWLEAAQATVRAFCGWHVAPVITETVRVTARGGDSLVLPSLCVRELKTIRFGSQTVEATGCVAWSREGVVRLLNGMRFPDTPGGVEVELTHGFEPGEVPDVTVIIATVARRAASQPGLVASQSVNGASVSYATAGGAPLSIPLLGIEKAALETYRLAGRL